MTPEQLNVQVGQMEIRNFAVNAATNYPTITAEYRDRWHTFEQLPRFHGKNVPALVLGSGPSLDDIVPYIRGWQGAIFAGPTNAANCLMSGVLPTYVVLIDTAADQAARYFQDPVLFADSVMITHPATAPENLDAWKGKRVFVQLVNDNLVYNVMMQALYPWMKTPVLSLGSTPNIAIELAWMLGYSPIIISGVDYASVNRKRRATAYTYTGPYRYLRAESADADDKYDHDLDFEYSHVALLTDWKFRKTHLLSISKGRVKEVPQISLEDCFAYRYPAPLSPEEIAARVDPVTAKSGVYMDAVTGRTYYQGAGQQMIDNLERELANAKDIASRWYQDVKHYWHFKTDGMYGEAKP